jgi:hypothetical protein
MLNILCIRRRQARRTRMAAAAATSIMITTTSYSNLLSAFFSSCMERLRWKEGTTFFLERSQSFFPVSTQRRGIGGTQVCVCMAGVPLTCVWLNHCRGKGTKGPPPPTYIHMEHYHLHHCRTIRWMY